MNSTKDSVEYIFEDDSSLILTRTLVGILSQILSFISSEGVMFLLGSGEVLILYLKTASKGSPAYVSENTCQ